MINFSVTREGEELDKSLYSWDEETRTFSTNEDDLVLDFSNINNCTIKTGRDCTLDTGWYCTIKTWDNCTLDTGDNCTINTGSRCAIKTEDYCTLDTGHDCTIEGGKETVVVRRDVYEIIELEAGQIIKLNGCGEKGYKVVNNHTITIDGKELELSEESYNTLKKSLNN